MLVVALIPAATSAQERSAIVAPVGHSDPLTRPNDVNTAVASLAAARILPAARFQWSGLATGTDIAASSSGPANGGRYASIMVKDRGAGQAETVYYDLQ